MTQLDMRFKPAKRDTLKTLLRKSIANARATQCQRLLTLLRSKEWVGLHEILNLRIEKYSSRITELRRKGYVIENFKELSMSGIILSRYRLLHEPMPPANQSAAQ